MSDLIKIPKQLIVKSEAERLITGEVYVPFRLDAQNEYMRPEEIKKACHAFMQLSGPDKVDSEHRQYKAGCTVVENYIAKASDPDGFHEGAWVAVGSVKSDLLWEQILKGERNGWSMMGRSFKREQLASIKAVTAIHGNTELSTLPNYPEHEHSYLVKFDPNGKVIACETGPAVYKKGDGPQHFHPIGRTTATDMADGHAHRFDINWSAKSDNVELEEREQLVKEIYNAEPRWLSIVQHAAIRRGFKIVKGDYSMDRVIQAILIEKGQKLEDAIADVEELEGLSADEIQPLKIHHMAKFDKYVLFQKADFEPESLEEISPKDGLRIIIGETKEGLDVDGISLGRKDKKKVFRVGMKKSEEGKSMPFTDEQKTELTGIISEHLKTALPSMLETEFTTLKGDIIKIIEKSGDDSGGADDTNGADDSKPEDTKKSGDDSGISALTESVNKLTGTVSELLKKSDDQQKVLDKYLAAPSTTPGAKEGADGGKEIPDEEFRKSDPDRVKAPGLLSNFRSSKVISYLKERGIES